MSVDDRLAVAESREDSVRRAFRRYDRDKSGAIDRDELALLLEDMKFDPRVVDEEFARADVTHTLRITFDEFCMYYNSLLTRISCDQYAILTRSTSPVRGGAGAGAGAGGFGGRSPRGSPAASPTSAPVATASAAAPPLVVEVVDEAPAGRLAPPPRPELIRFDSITDEIEAFKRGDITEAASAPVVDTRLPCSTCGRMFVPKSHARHEAICARATANSKARGKFSVKRTRY